MDGAHREGAPTYPVPGARRLARHQVHLQPESRDNQTFQPLPRPTGAAPFRLPLEKVLGADAVARIRAQGALGFHTVGDTGGVKFPVPQQIVAMHLAADCGSGTGAPAFLYHLGDVVYYNGQNSEYYAQFYEPYADYPLPVLAIPGNHDGDPLDSVAEPSLTAFVEQFCAPASRLTPQAQEVHRSAMIQPNVYWTLLAPFVTIVGVYSNVPEGGEVKPDQAAWLSAEIAAARPDAALIVALHHPVYSADAHHGGSARMGEVLDTAVASAGRWPDMILTGHIHNYQRFTRRVAGRDIPYIVAGAGGYWHLHYMARGDDGGPLVVPWPAPNLGVTLEQYCDDRHGFLRLEASATTLHGRYVSVPRPHESWRAGPVTVVDDFTLDLARHAMLRSPNGVPSAP